MVTQLGTATTIAQLNADIATVNAAQDGTGGPVTYEIAIRGTIAESQAITAIALHSGVNLDIVGVIGGGAAAVNGSGGSFGGFFVQSGNVTIQNLLVENTTALGGSGSYGATANSGDSNGGGGGGLGAGGGLFVASGAAVTLDDVTFSGTHAVGGSLSSSGVTATGGALDGRTGIGSFGSGGQGGIGTGTGGNAGFGAGGGGGATPSNASGASGGLGGFGGTSGYQAGFGTGGPGGAGAGMGGAVFVQAGGTLIVAGSGGTSGTGASGGSGYQARGEGFGQGYYLQGSGTSLTFEPGTGQTITIANEIADDTGSDIAAGYTSPSNYTPGSGSLIVNGATGLSAGDGSGAVPAGTLILSSGNNYVGGTTIESGILDLTAAGAAGRGAITFAGSSNAPATLMLGSAAQSQSSGTGGPAFSNTLSAFGANDSLDLVGLKYTTGGAGTPLTPSGNTLLVSEGGEVEKFTLANVPPGTSYYAHPDSAGSGTVIDTVCFAAGTRIRTSRGDVAVEDLRLGDLVVTASGAHRPIRWLGHRAIDCLSHPQPDSVIPVRIRAHAFGENRPARDLLVSPGHAIALDLLGEVLIPAYALINGLTIVAEPVDRVTYWHVELDSHDLLLAENQPAESYLEMGNRAFFAGSTGDGRLVDLTALPDADPASRTSADFCRPFHERGALVETVRAQMRRRAVELGWRVVAPRPWDGVRLEVDGKSLLPEVDPDTSRMSARFALPPAARDIWLVCPTAVPAEVDPDNGDARALGLCLSEVIVDDGWSEPRRIALADPRLCVGFHRIEADHRWTAGIARLPADLFGRMSGPALLCLTLFAPPLPRWQEPEQAPEAASGTTRQADLNAKATRPLLRAV